MKANEMIDRYVHEVGQHLPSKSRQDIQLELRSLVQDTLDEQAADSGTEPTTKMVAAVLQEFGRPEEIAAQYRPTQALIGSNLLPAYKLVLTIVISVMGGLHLLGLLFSISQNEIANLGGTLINLVFSFGQSAFVNIGIITLIFAGLERLNVGVYAWPASAPTTWDPYQLPPVKDPNRINRFEIIAGIFFSVFFIILFNFFYEWVGFIDLAGDERGVIPFFAPEFSQFIPWLTASWAVDTLLKIVVLAQGRWNRSTRIAELGTASFGLYVLYLIYNSPTITIVPFFTTAAHGILAIVLVIVMLDLLSKVFRLLFKRPVSSAIPFKSKFA
jgi:hypothetical protein